MSSQPDEWVVDFPTLGFLASDWIEAHCTIPDGFDLGQPFQIVGWQLWSTVNHYRVKPDIKFNPRRPLLAQAFHYRRSLIVGPQKVGKGPWSAGITCFEAVGPCLFAGWAKGGEAFRCVDHGCDCGFEYEYEPGEPMGMPRPKSLVQLLATSEAQVDNIFVPLQSMIRGGPLEGLMRVGEGLIRLPNNGKIEPVTASPNSKLGNPVNFFVHDESGLYTASNKLLKISRTMARGAAGMGGRGIETSNAWDPMENSRLQQGFASKTSDLFRFHREPPRHLRYRIKRDRRKIHQYVYFGSPWVDLNGIEAEAVELMETDPAEAERFYGNRIVQGLGSFMTAELWKTNEAFESSTEKRIALGFDGSSSDDWTVIRAETIDGYRFTPTYTVGGETRTTIWNPAEHGGRIPRAEVRTAVEQIFARYSVGRMYCDPRDWQTEIDEWALEHGEDVVAQWPTNQITRMHMALVRYRTDISEGATVHDGCETTKEHALNARMLAKPGERFILGKPAQHLKIDAEMADVVAHEAAADLRAEGWADEIDTTVLCFTQPSGTRDRAFRR